MKIIAIFIGLIWLMSIITYIVKYVIVKRCIKHRYYKRFGQYYDFKKMISIYKFGLIKPIKDIDKYIFSTDSKNRKFLFDTNELTKITKDEFYRDLSNSCNCPIGTSPKIVNVLTMNYIDSFKEYCKNNNITNISCTPTDESYLLYTIKMKYDKVYSDRITIYKYDLSYDKRACVVCNTCLNNITTVNKNFDKIVSSLKSKAAEYEKAYNICNKIVFNRI